MAVTRGRRSEAYDLCILISDLWRGGVAQLGERLLCKQEVIGSNPFTSTTGPPPAPALPAASSPVGMAPVKPAPDGLYGLRDVRRRLNDTAAGDRGEAD
jgi:hypothetical protein